MCGLVVIRARDKEEEGEGGRVVGEPAGCAWAKLGIKELLSPWLGPQEGRGREDELLYREPWTFSSWDSQVGLTWNLLDIWFPSSGERSGLTFRIISRDGG